MRVFELAYPGTWIDLPDPGQAQVFNAQLSLLANYLAEAGATLGLFQAACAQTVQDQLEDRDRDAQRLYELQSLVERVLGVSIYQLPRDRAEFARERLTREVKRERWARSEMPREYADRLPFLYARSFIFALDYIGKTLAVLAKEPGAPPELKAISADFNSQLPSLTQVRDTAHHPEDRSRRKGRGDKPLNPKPVKTRMIRAPGGMVGLDNLEGNRYGCTLADGGYGEVEISAETLEKAQACIQRVLDAFKWTGSPRYEP